MSYLFVFLLIFCFSVGFVTLALSIILLIKIKSKLSLYFIIFLLFFLIIIFIASLSFFLELFMVIPHELDLIFSIGSQLSALVINFIMILFMYDFLQVFVDKKKYLTVIIIIFLLSLTMFFIYLFTGIGTADDNRIKTFHINDIFIFLLPFYSIVLFFIYYKRVKNIVITRIIRSIIIISIFFLPILFLENFNLNINIDYRNFSILHFRLLTFPLYYLIFNLILLFYGIKYIHMISLPGLKDFNISLEFIKRFNITKREKELIHLIYEGCSNKQIGNQLFISPATVRNHLHNIYEKTGSKNRVELLRFCNQ